MESNQYQYSNTVGLKCDIIKEKRPLFYTTAEIYAKYEYEKVWTVNPDTGKNKLDLIPTEQSAFKMLYLSIQQIQEKWEVTRIRNWSEIYPQLSIFFSEIMSKYTK